MNQETLPSNFKRSKNVSRSAKRDLFIPAFFVDPPNLEMYTALQNLMWYAVECLNSLPSISGKDMFLMEHFFKCVSLLSLREKESGAALDGQLKKLFMKFLDESKKAETLLKGFFDNPGNTAKGRFEEVIPRSQAGTIAAAATQLQWLAVCFSMEFSFLPPHHG
jgi:hypothetical protein